MRAARREDIPAIVATSNTSVTEEEVAGFGGPSSTNPYADVERLRAAWRDPNRVHSEEVIVAELGGEVVAYATLEDRGESSEIVNIDVAREHQRQGIGTALVRWVEARARSEGRQAVTLGTSRNAEGVPWKSLPWWQSLGYRITHEEENAWTRSIGPGAREIRMRKQLVDNGPISLRPVHPDDLEHFFEQQQDPVASYLAAFTAKDPSDRETFRSHWDRILADPRIIMRTIILSGQVVGNVGSYLEPDSGRREVTYWIARTGWGRGIATHALSAFLEEERTRPLYARAAHDNVGSIRVLEKCGFRAAGRESGFANARGRILEEVVFELPAGKTAKP